MNILTYPVIDPAATGANIRRLRIRKGFSVRDLQEYFGFEAPQAIYKWQTGQSLPSVDNLFALSHLFGVSMNDIIVRYEHGQSSDRVPYKGAVRRAGTGYGIIFLPEYLRQTLWVIFKTRKAYTC